MDKNQNGKIWKVDKWKCVTKPLWQTDKEHAKWRLMKPMCPINKEHEQWITMPLWHLLKLSPDRISRKKRGNMFFTILKNASQNTVSISGSLSRDAV